MGVSKDFLLHTRGLRSQREKKCSFFLLSFYPLGTHVTAIITKAKVGVEYHVACKNALANIFVMIFIGLSRGSNMLKMAKISFWLPFLRSSDLTLSQIATETTVKHFINKGKEYCANGYLLLIAPSSGIFALQRSKSTTKSFFERLCSTSQISSSARVDGSSPNLVQW